MVLDVLLVSLVIFVGSCSVFILNEYFSESEVKLRLLELFVAISDMSVGGKEHENAALNVLIESVHKFA